MNSRNRRDDSPLLFLCIFLALIMVMAASAQSTPSSVVPDTSNAPTETNSDQETEADQTTSVPTTTETPAVNSAITSTDDSVAEPATDESLDPLDHLPMISDVLDIIEDQQNTPENPQYPTDDQQETLPQMPDYSYLRLIQQGKIQLSSSVALDNQFSYNRPDLPEALAIASEEQAFYAVPSEQLSSEPGTILSTIECDDFTSTISVPVLPETLQEFINQRGEHALMIYTAYSDGRIDASVLFSYDDQILVLVIPQYTYHAVSALPKNHHISMSYSFDHDIWPDEVDPNHILDAENASACYYLPRGSINDGQYYNYDNNYNNIYCCMAEYQDGGISAFNVDYQKFGIAEFTETSYTPTDAQIEHFIAMVQAYEATPLPPNVLELLAMDSDTAKSGTVA